ncbi:MAG: ABC transporter ATP-binding protein [Planctomycetes bacterium]|nr:ABC transporter ATP-binding protein [Planctomycetota bacterium]
MAIKLEDLRMTWREPDGRERHVLDVPLLEVPDASQLCLVGHSGSGKTTLLNVIAGIVRPSAGRVFVGGEEISAMGEAQRDLFRARHVGYVFQTFNLLQGLTAVENVMLAMSFAGVAARPARERAEHLLDRVGLSERRRARPATMSVGEQQRVAIARALANRPMVVLADEPTANLDERNAAETIDLLRETTSEENSILLLVTHDAEVRDRFDDVRELREISR